MNILLVARLSQETLHTFVESIAAHDENCSVFVLRDLPYRSASKNIFNVHGSYSEKTWLRHLRKLLDGVRCILTNKVDVIISIHLYPHGYLGRLLSMLTRKPLIHVVIAGKREFFLYGSLIEGINHIIFRNIRLIAVTGTLTKNYLLANGHLQEHIAMLPNVIRTDMFCSSAQSKIYDIVFAARIDKNKNIDIFLEALSDLKKNGWCLKTVVTGKGANEKKFKSLIKTMNLGDTVIFLGWIDYKELPRLYNESKLFVLTSRGEGFPLALLEAMACGVPPICTGVGDIPDVVRHNENGLLLADPNDKTKLAEYIERLLNDKALYDMISQNAKKVRESYSIEASTTRWRELLSRMTERSQLHG